MVSGERVVPRSRRQAPGRLGDPRSEIDVRVHTVADPQRARVCDERLAERRCDLLDDVDAPTGQRRQRLLRLAQRRREFPNLFGRWDELEATDYAFQLAVSQSGRSYRDLRIRSVFAVAPALGRAFIPASLRRLPIPVAIIAGIGDRIVPIGSNAQLLATLVPGASLMLLPGTVEHYTFLATCMEAGRRMQPTLCTDAQGVDREQIHQRTVESAVQFFDRAMK